MSGKSDALHAAMDRRAIICVGTGGVGKTTIAATIALQAARHGARALVVTIDPARRLAGALGLDDLGPEPMELPIESRTPFGITGDGRLFAMMLDMKRTFDALVERFAEDEAARMRILDNAIYQHVSDALAGSAEYAAMEKVYELLESRRFDLVVLDTPPAQNAIDFLDAPRRLLEFLDSRLVRLLIHPTFAAGRLGWRVFQRPTVRMLGLLERLLGMGFLRDLSEFLLAFEAMASGFRERATRVRAMLLGPEAGFVLVAGPSFQAARNAEAFLEHLVEQRVPLAGIVLNRVRTWRDSEPGSLLGLGDDAELDADRRALIATIQVIRPEADAESVAAEAFAVARQYDGLVKHDWRNTAALRSRAHELGLFERSVSELPADVHDRDGLRALAAELFSDERRTADAAASNGAA